MTHVSRQISYFKGDLHLGRSDLPMPWIDKSADVIGVELVQKVWSLRFALNCELSGN